MSHDSLAVDTLRYYGQLDDEASRDCAIEYLAEEIATDGSFGFTVYRKADGTFEVAAVIDGKAECVADLPTMYSIEQVFKAGEKLVKTEARRLAEERLDDVADAAAGD